MASLFRPRRPEPPPPDQREGATWLSGMVSGAGKLISSVFRSGSPSRCSSSSYSSDSESYEDEGVLLSSKEIDAVNQSGKQLEVFRDSIEGSLAIVSKVEPKHAIEQLLMQETFSRDEGIKLMNIIQSRVVDFPNADDGEDGLQKELLGRTSGNAIAYPGGWQSLNHTTKRSEWISYSPYSLNALSPASSSRPLHSPELNSTAVMEAKKWLEEKKLVSSSKSDLGCGPCILNTDMPHYELKGKKGSPVDVAKRYMQTLPPWQSPSLCSNGFEIAQSGAMHSYKDETPKEAAINYLPSFQALKRKSLGLGSQEALDETRRFRLKLTDHMSEFNTFKHFDLSARLSESVACKTPSEPFEGVKEVLGTSHYTSLLQDAPSLGGPSDLPAKLPVENHPSDRALGSHDKRAFVVNDPLKVGNETSANIVLNAEDAATARQSTNKNSRLEPPHPVVGNEFMSDDPATKLNDNQDVEEPSQIEEPVRVSVPHDSFILGLASRKHDDSRSPKCRKGNDQAQKETNGSIDNQKRWKGNDQAQKETNESIDNIIFDSTSGLNRISHVEDHHQSNFNEVKPTSILSKRTRKTTTRGPKASKITSRSQNEMDMKPFEQVLTEAEEPSIRGTGEKKAVGRPRRGRGRGK